ncbi:MAG: hypothetical protein KM310_09375 [Clostridiales bacterium]|nr:hypothetical protein [Clostridiales bacterium]
MKLLPRSEVPAEETWDLSHLYPSDEAWEKDLERISALIERVKGFQGKLTTASALLNLLKAMEELMETFSRVAAYPSLQQATDGTHPGYQAQSMKVNLKGQEMQEALSFVEPELLALPEETWERFLQEEPSLQAYRPYIRRLLRRKPHVLSEEGERILGSLSAALAAPSIIYRRASAADLSFPPVEHQGRKMPLTVSRYDQYLASPDRALRQKAHAALGEGLKGLHTTLATTLALHIQKNVAVARLRGYPSAEAMFLHPQDIPMEVYENVLDVIHEEMAPAVRRWVELRKKVLGLPEVHTYDLFTRNRRERPPFQGREQLVET